MGAQTSKAEVFAQDAKAAGWTTKYGKDGSRETVVAVKTKDCVLSMNWEDGRYDYGSSGLVVQGQTRTVRNAAEARRMLAGQGIQPVTERKPVRKRSKATAEPVDGKSKPKVVEEPEEEEPKPRPIRLPFKVSSPSEVIRKAVIGKEITWINSRTRAEESARVLKDPNQKQLRIEYTREKRRVLTFAAYGQGFRSVHIDAIVSVK